MSLKTTSIDFEHGERKCRLVAFNAHYVICEPERETAISISMDPKWHSYTITMTYCDDAGGTQTKTVTDRGTAYYFVALLMEAFGGGEGGEAFPAMILKAMYKAGTYHHLITKAKRIVKGAVS